MSAAGAEIDRVDGSSPLDDPGERGEVLALRVDRALDVSLGSRTELIRDEFFMNFRHRLASDFGGRQEQLLYPSLRAQRRFHRVSNCGSVWIASLSLAMTGSALLLFADRPSDAKIMTASLLQAELLSYYKC